MFFAALHLMAGLSLANVAHADFASIAWGRDYVDGQQKIAVGFGRGRSQLEATDQALARCHLVYNGRVRCSIKQTIFSGCIFITSVQGGFPALAGISTVSWEKAVTACETSGYVCQRSPIIGTCIDTPEDDVENNERE